MVRILHLSDIHFKINNYNTERIRIELLKTLKEKGKGYYKYLFVSGDFLYQYENGGSFESVGEFLNKILDITGITKENIFFVPGNHDIKRSGLRTKIINGLKSEKNELKNDLEDDVYDELMKAQEKYIEFYNTFLNRNYNVNQLHYVYEKDDINILGINSCLMSGLSGEEKDLSIYLKKLLSCVEGMKQNTDKINVVIIHHSLEYLSEYEKEEVKKLLADYDFDIIFSGHTHKSKFEEITIGCKKIRFICSGSVVDDEYSDVNFVEVELESNKASVVYYKWYENLSQWRIDVACSRSANQAGRINFNITKVCMLKSEVSKEKSIEGNQKGSCLETNNYNFGSNSGVIARDIYGG